MMHWTFIVVAILMAGVAVSLLAATLLMRMREHRLVAQRIGESSALGMREIPGKTSARKGTLWQAVLMRPATDLDMDLLLRRAGLVRARERAVAALLLRTLPWGVLIVSVLMFMAAGGLDAETVVIVALLGLAAFVLPRHILATVAYRRQTRIGDQVQVVVQLLRLLFDSGHSVEGALRVVAQEGRALAPDLARELDIALQRVGTGLGLDEALGDMARILVVPELDDTVLIVKQLVQQGGSVREPLQRLMTLIEDRQQTRVQEKVTKMSAKMSVVMMVFLFPALLAVLAAPGFVSLISALGGLHG
ncbi:type II secretion system F family protein [Thioalkalivibrio sp. ALE28]|uniref:type II secretion system F family protein n=1 Tax=Thioalkalivibrio sp. ALE28 TaxID=1158179 RepID=UPI0003802DCE|nr:type II secretion system F family protein [Thioalkalivibrio sp. ALE28]